MRDRQAVQWADRLAGGQGGVGGIRGRPRTIGVQGHDGVDRGIQPLDPPQVRLEQLTCGDLPVAHHGGQLGGGPEAQVVAHRSSLSRPRLRGETATRERWR
jgi:hypothetical protein